MLNKQLKNYNIILASGSPRRQAFFKTLGLDFEIRLKQVYEVYPKHLIKSEITDYLAQLKAKAFTAELQPNDILITSDTIVWHNNQAVEKPKDKTHAIQMISQLCGSDHEVYTSVCFTQPKHQITVNACTKVTFETLSKAAIVHYVDHFKPMDKAGAYGIQEWIGAVAISKIEGSYNNVVGLPTHLVYKTLNDIVNKG